MTFEKGQKVYFIYRIKAAHKNSHKWKVNEGIVVSDNGRTPKVEIKVAKGLLKMVKRKHIFVDLRCAESRCEYWNHWGKYHKNISYRGRKKK